MVKINKEVFNQIVNKYQLNITVNDLISGELITKEEYKKIVRISAAHYDAENICV